MVSHIKKARSKRYPAQAVTDAGYADFLALRANTPAQIESLLRNQEQAVERIGLHVNANKTEFICFKQSGVMSTLSDRSLKLDDMCPHRCTSVYTNKMHREKT